jgi:hypothetical protein
MGYKFEVFKNRFASWMDGNGCPDKKSITIISSFLVPPMFKSGCWTGNNIYNKNIEIISFLYMYGAIEGYAIHFNRQSEFRQLYDYFCKYECAKNGLSYDKFYLRFFRESKGIMLIQEVKKIVSIGSEDMVEFLSDVSKDIRRIVPRSRIFEILECYENNDSIKRIAHSMSLD